MSESRIAKAVAGQPAERRNRRWPARPLRAAPIGGIALVVLASGFLGAPPQAAGARDQPASGQKVQSQAAAMPQSSVSEIRRTLKKQHDRMIDLANQLIVENGEAPADLEGQIAAEPSVIASTHASLQGASPYAKPPRSRPMNSRRPFLSRKKPQPKQSSHSPEMTWKGCNGVSRISKERRALIDRVTKDPQSDIDVTPLVMAELEETKATFVLEQAQSKLRVLVEYTKPFRTKELRSNVDDAKSAESKVRGAWEREQLRLRQLQEATKACAAAAHKPKAPNVHDHQALVALDHAITIDEQLRTKLDQLAKVRKPDGPERDEVSGLTNRLEALLKQAEIERSAAQFDELKAKIHPTLAATPVTTTASQPVRPAGEPPSAAMRQSPALGDSGRFHGRNPLERKKTTRSLAQPREPTGATT